VALGEFHYLPSWLFPWNLNNGRFPKVVTASALRSDDFLSLDFEFDNFTLDTSSNPAKLLPAGNPAYIIVTFPPQSVAEQAFYEVPSSNFSEQDSNGNPLTPGMPGYEPNPNSGETPSPRPVKALLSGSSRLVFIVPSSESSIPFTLDGILGAISNYDLNVAPVALPPPSSNSGLKLHIPTSPPQISQPASNVTAIEAPNRLVISPHQSERWTHATDPVSNNGVTELWHTRLAFGTLNNGVLDETVPSYIRAIWSPDYGSSLSSPPPHFSPNTPYTLPGQTPYTEFRSGLDARDRFELVHLTSNFKIPNYTPVPATINKLMLTSFGAWLDLAGTWAPPNPLEVEGWNHVSTMGRDHYVRVVYEGFLFPFGHSASLIKVTERKFDPSPETNSVNSQTSYLRQRMFVVVRQPVVNYPTLGMQHSGRKFPFTSLKITTAVTPDLDDPTSSEAYTGQGQDAFWPQVGGQDFRFVLVGTDSDGQASEFTLPLIFVGASVAIPQDNAHQSILYEIINTYRANNNGRIQPQLLGQRIAFAPSSSAGGTSFETQSIDLAAETRDFSQNTPPNSQPQFYPAFADANIRIAAVAQLTPNASKLQPQTTITFPDLYLQNGFSQSANVGEVFAQISSADQIPLDFSSDADKAGGMITPSINISGLSRISGLVGAQTGLNDSDLATYLGSVASGQFNPSDFFGLASAKILGGITLSDILNSGSISQAPAISTHVIYQNNNPQMAPQAFETILNWDGSALVKEDPTHTFQPSGSNLNLQALIHTDLTGNPVTTFQITATLTNFSIHLIPSVLEFIVISFTNLKYLAQSGQKPQVNAAISGIQFAGPLSFINELENYIPLAGFEDPPSITVTPEGVAVGYSLAIPSIGVGIFTLSNVSFGAQLTLPFTSDPARARFSFASREHPFTLAVSLFAGGGFFATSVGLDGVELLEGSFEFGGNFSIDIGVASGGVYANAGIYYKIMPVSGGDECQLTGFFQCGGSLEILGLISISEQFYLGLTYDTSSNDVYGQATITAEISVAFVSKSVSLTVEKSFGHSSPPAFADLVSPPDWLNYTQAFSYGA